MRFINKRFINKSLIQDIFLLTIKDNLDYLEYSFTFLAKDASEEYL